MIEKETKEYNIIQELLKQKQKSGKWDITCVVQDENGNLQNFNVINLIVDYANAMEELTKQKVSAFDIAQRLLTIDTFRFENFKKGIDDHLLYNAPVTSQEYLDRRGQENRGAENLGQFNSKGDYEYAIAIFKNWGEEYLKRDEGIYAVLVHEFTHYLATHYIQDEKYIKEFMEQNPEVFISTDDQLSAYDENRECKPLTRYDVFSGVSRKNGKEFFDIQLGVEKDEEGSPIRDENGNLKVKGILHEQLNSYQRREENSRRITHTRLTEGFTEHIAHLLLEKMYGKSFRELPFEQDKYAAEVSMAELYFKKKDVGDAVYEYITNPQQIIAELEDIETKDGNDLFHETTRYLNLNHNIGLLVQNIMAMNTKFQSIITGEPTTQEDIDNIANNTADIIESDFKDQKYQIISEDKIIEILKKETSIERLKALIDFQKQNDSPQIQYLILKEVGPALQEFYDEKNMIYSLYENLNTKTKEEKIVMNNEELQYSKSEEENLKKVSTKVKQLDVTDCEFDNSESCYHLTRGVHENSIAKNGLGAQIGVRSKDGAGNEDTPKVFFTKSIEGALILINRTFNFFYTAVKDNNFTILNGALGDDTPELYKKIFNNMIHDNMAEDEIDEVALELGKLYLERGICYKLHLKHCTREEFQNMNEQEQAQIDYFSDDINEENGKPMTINNMHTRTGRGVKTSQMSLTTCNGKKSALDIAISMVEAYRILNPGKSVPVLKFKNGDEDRHLLEMLVDKEQERRHNAEMQSTKTAKFSAKDMEDFLKSVTEETTISGFTNMTQNIKNNQKAIEEKNQTQNNDTKENKGWDIDDN